MSTFVHAKIACVACAHTYDGDVAESLHVSTRPDLRDDILAGRFHRFACPACGAFTVIEKLLAYTDFDRHHWFTVVGAVELPFLSEWRAFAREAFQKTMLERSPALVRDQIAPEMRQRLVFGLASLREKLLAFDAGLDDRVLELLKLEVLRERGVTPDWRLACHLVATSPDTLEIELAAPSADDTRAEPVVEQVTLARSDYECLEAKRGELAQRWPELWDDLAVDWRALFVPVSAAATADAGGAI